MTYALGSRSMANLAGVEPRLMRLVQRAITLTTMDFGVAGKAVRTAMEQHELYLKGVSQKDGYRHKSNHQPHVDGFGYAVDLTPFINGQFDVNNLAAQYPIAAAMSRASAQLGIPVTWGGNWMTPLTGESVSDMKSLEARYRVQHPGPDWTDLPHFELR